MSIKQKFILITKKFIPLKSLSILKKTHGGRNWSGKIVTRHRGSKIKKKFKIIDYHRALWHTPALLTSFVYDPNRNTLIALLYYSSGIGSYIIAIEGLQIGGVYMSGVKVKRKEGNCFPLKWIAVGVKINTLEIKLYRGGTFLRSAGVFGKILKKTNKICLIRLKSGKMKKINYFCIATLGVIMNFNYYLNRYKNAGWSRLKGFRPHVRGVAMNPVDHPYGGGEGKKSKKSISMSPWGILVKGKKTRI